MLWHCPRHACSMHHCWIFCRCKQDDGGPDALFATVLHHCIIKVHSCSQSGTAVCITCIPSFCCVSALQPATPLLQMSLESACCVHSLHALSPVKVSVLFALLSVSAETNGRRRPWPLLQRVHSLPSPGCTRQWRHAVHRGQSDTNFEQLKVEGLQIKALLVC